MTTAMIIEAIRKELPGFTAGAVTEPYSDEVHLDVGRDDLQKACLALHCALGSPVAMLFASDERAALRCFVIRCVFIDIRARRWIVVRANLPEGDPAFASLARSIYSASLFEREIKEMFGIEPKGNPDLRRLHLHDEVWGAGSYPLRKDFSGEAGGAKGVYRFSRVDGEGVFEVPVGPVHAGIIPPGHFRFSVAGEPIINLEIRLGFTHRGAEKLFEGRAAAEGIRLAERIAGDMSFAHSLAFAEAVEKINAMAIPDGARYFRAICLELERMYNHINDIGGIALDVGYTFPAAFASIIKEGVLQLNRLLTGSRYLRGVVALGGVSNVPDGAARKLLAASLENILRDHRDLVRMLYGSASFMDRVDTTGILRVKTAEDLGIVGPAARASGIPTDLRAHFSDIYREARFSAAVEQTGDVLARLKVRIAEFEESARLIGSFAQKLAAAGPACVVGPVRGGAALGYVEGWRGPVLYWVAMDPSGTIERCKVVDPSFHNWQGLSFAVLGNIIPDFPLCNKSFDLSYSGNDL